MTLPFNWAQHRDDRAEPRRQWWEKPGLQPTAREAQPQQPASGIYSACLNGTKINIHILDILRVLSKRIAQPRLMKQPHPIQKVILVKAGASGKERKCKWLQMRSICRQPTRELPNPSSRAGENEHNRKRKPDFTILEPALRNTGLFFLFL